MNAIEYIDYLIEMEYKPICSECGKEMRFKGAIFYKGKVYCMDCRRKLKQKEKLKEADFDDFNYRELIAKIHDTEEWLKDTQAKRISPNSKVIKSRGKDITVGEYNERKRKEEIEYLQNKLKNLNTDLDEWYRNKSKRS